MLVPFPCTRFGPYFFPTSSSKSAISPQLIYRTRWEEPPCLTLAANPSNRFHSTFPNNALSRKSSSSKNRHFLQIPHVGKSSVPEEDDRRALEAVLRLYSALENRNLRELSSVIGDECRCVCNFISCFHPFQGKKQVLEVFSFLMKTMGENLEFVVQPTLPGGMQVAVRWKLEWQNSKVPLGKGFSFYTCHTYQGKVVISNMEMFMEPLLHFEPLRLKLIGLVMPVLDKIGSFSIIKVKGKRAIYVVVALVIIISLIFIFRLRIL